MLRSVSWGHVPMARRQPTAGPPCQNRPMPDPRPLGRSAPDGPGPSGSPATERTRLRRLAQQGSYRSEDLHAVLDAGFVCHLGLVVAEGPMVVPTSYGRAGDHLYLHGSVASRSLRAAREPVP